MTDKTNIITANRLDDGLVVYFQSLGKWTLDIQAATAIADGELEGALVLAKKDSAARLVVGIYDFPVMVSDAQKITTLSAKEEIRALHKPTIGPSA